MCRPWMAPHGATPTTGTSRPYLCIASPTSFITPESVPPVKIHAFVTDAAATRPRSKTRCSWEVSCSDIADPVTEMSTSGRGSAQYFSRKCESIAVDAVFEMVRKFAARMPERNEMAPKSAIPPFFRAKMTGPNFLYMYTCLRYQRCRMMALSCCLIRCSRSAGRRRIGSGLPARAEAGGLSRRISIRLCDAPADSSRRSYLVHDGEGMKLIRLAFFIDIAYGASQGTSSAVGRGCRYLGPEDSPGARARRGEARGRRLGRTSEAAMARGGKIEDGGVERGVQGARLSGTQGVVWEA
mmetsp:Transcript_302/g.687  ORF Transcript_302/g.687 Transcript_302/m.687 type:complete len:297 (+) Transcript_302:3721-4611(+)